MAVTLWYVNVHDINIIYVATKEEELKMPVEQFYLLVVHGNHSPEKRTLVFFLGFSIIIIWLGSLWRQHHVTLWVSELVRRFSSVTIKLMIQPAQSAGVSFCQQLTVRGLEHRGFKVLHASIVNICADTTRIPLSNSQAISKQFLSNFQATVMGASNGHSTHNVWHGRSEQQSLLCRNVNSRALMGLSNGHEA